MQALTKIFANLGLLSISLSFIAPVGMSVWKGHGFISTMGWIFGTYFTLLFFGLLFMGIARKLDPTLPG